MLADRAHKCSLTSTLELRSLAVDRATNVLSECVLVGQRTGSTDRARVARPSLSTDWGRVRKAGKL